MNHLFTCEFTNPCFIHDEDEFTLTEDESSEDEVDKEAERKAQLRRKIGKAFAKTLLVMATCSILYKVFFKK